MKISRHAKIIEIIQSKDVETQEQLAQELKNNGFDITQATVSRDIKELKLIKVMNAHGTHIYSTSSPGDSFLSNKLVNIFSQTVLYVDNVDKFIVLKTISGAGAAAAEALDSLKFSGIVGTVAGDNTVFILVRNEEDSKDIIQKVKKMISE
ncbi:arginine repressor [Clostridium estertheticum]|uniref:Arginine repressor n=1 Tax=Clostridium estertheticum TaxID=238834 RepID=A0A7Y3SWY7_9CLOT|nr:arginine repressor [Clostridium estertheticum]MBW9170741.1 arginine repressor [Clostridium estertheticum]MBX4265270.1 arginine repressor [Clostridium estertheticum]MBX4269307.1 arginine repressor [Clostridium estertheticum]MCB2308029.1 arginine repressor [Clostridium estertheticum]MCB2346153.1 arginine repressor [Clostridium estertheticum]